ncbi:MAG: DUF928 domain-containing protein [Spirulina sp.]
MLHSYRNLTVVLLTSGWIFSTSLPVFSQVRVEDLVNFIPPEEAIAIPHYVGGNPCNCIQYPPNTTLLTPLIPKLSHRFKQNISNSKSICRFLPSFGMNLLKRCGSNDPRLNPHRGGLTSHSFPSFFVYVPKTNAKAGDFLLIEHLENGTLKELYHREFPLPVESGIVRIPSPVALEEGKTYEWHFALICNVTERATDAIAVGTIKRIALSPRLQSRIDRSSLTTQLELYGKAGLWYDFFELLTGTQKRSRLFREAWETLLRREFGQDSQIPQASILPCCLTIARDE